MRFAGKFSHPGRREAQLPQLLQNLLRFQEHSGAVPVFLSLILIKQGRRTAPAEFQRPFVFADQSRHTRSVEAGLRAQAQCDFLAVDIDLRDVSLMGHGLDAGDEQEVFHRPRDIAEAVNELILHVGVFVLVFDAGDPLVYIELLVLIADVGGRDVGVNVAVLHGFNVFGVFTFEGEDGLI